MRNIATDKWRQQTASTKPNVVLVGDLENTAALTAGGHSSETVNPVWKRDFPAVLAERDLIESAIGRLSETHRQVIQLVYYKGLTVPEAAEITGWPLGTTKSRVFYALRRLRTVLSELADPEDLADLARSRA
jgi:RNA polymerase sigma factor (sigma-70 family)